MYRLAMQIPLSTALIVDLNVRNEEQGAHIYICIHSTKISIINH